MGVFDLIQAVNKIWNLSTQMRLTTKEIKQALQSCYRTTNERKGTSDILGFVRKTGQFIAVEIKGKGDKLSIEQQQFLKEVAESGLAFVVSEEPDKINLTILGSQKVTVCNEDDFITLLRQKMGI